jgi:hypothetical protein
MQIKTINQLQISLNPLARSGLFVRQTCCISSSSIFGGSFFDFSIMENQLNINLTRKHDITKEEVRACSLFEHFSDKEAAEVIRTIKELTNIVYYVHSKENGKNEN